MAVPAPRLLSFWQRSHDMNDLCAKPRIATWGFSKSGRKMRPDIVHNSKFLPRQGRGNPCCPRARGAVLPERAGFLLFRLRLCSKGGVRMIDSKRTRFSRRVLNGRQRPYGKRGDSHTSDVHGSQFTAPFPNLALDSHIRQLLHSPRIDVEVWRDDDLSPGLLHRCHYMAFESRIVPERAAKISSPMRFPQHASQHPRTIPMRSC